LRDACSIWTATLAFDDGIELRAVAMLSVALSGDPAQEIAARHRAG
jgi:hypothetical protein